MRELTDLWPLINETVFQFWGVLHRPINEACEREGLPHVLHDYIEMGLEHFSAEEFARRDPYSNPAGFEGEFATLAEQGWIEPEGNGRYRVTERARELTAAVVRAGDAYLGTLEPLPSAELERLRALLARVREANLVAAEPPTRWATVRRFRVADADTPALGGIRELGMDLFAYRDDAHTEAWREHEASGLLWDTFSHVQSGDGRFGAEIASAAAFRGYAAADYDDAIAQLVARGWLAPDGEHGRYRATAEGDRLRTDVEHLTDQYFYAPWAVLADAEVGELRSLLTRLRDRLREQAQQLRRERRAARQ